EIGRAETLRGKDKRFLFYFNSDASYRHYSPALPGLDRGRQAPLKATFRCFEDYERARAITLRFKIENVARTEQFQARLNGQPLEPNTNYTANGRDTRIHTVALGPYLEYDVTLRPSQLQKGDNLLEVKAVRLLPDLTTKINLAEI